MNSIGMSDMEKKSFYSFLGLYIFTSLLFISLVAYWYYTAQKSALENETYYKLEHLADLKSGTIIMAHMSGHTLKNIPIPDNIKLALIDTDNKVVEGKLIDDNVKIRVGYFQHLGYNILISDGPREHLNVKYVVLQSKMLSEELALLKQRVLSVFIVILLSIIVIAWILAKLFMKPMRERILQIERFLNDITHELNTPITSLTMATDQALKQGKCTAKTLNNVSISTKQLYDIYRSLTYLNFRKKEKSIHMIVFDEVLQKSIAYYTPLAEMKRIIFDVELEKMQVLIPETQLSLLFGNLIGNAIKYSSPNSVIEITLQNKVLRIKDEGIGIELNKQKEIFQKYQRGTDYSGGFGVGLNIVKSICDEYSIQIVLDSTLGKGSEFILYFNGETRC